MSYPIVTNQFFNSTAPPSGFINNSANASIFPVNYQNGPLVTFESDPTTYLNQSQPLHVISNFESKHLKQIFPTVGISTVGIQEVTFNFTTNGWIHPSELILCLTKPVTGRSSLINSPGAYVDQPLTSTKIQAPFAFLNDLDYIKGYIGELDESKVPDGMISSNILATKSIMCHRPRSSADHKTAFTAGLPCQKSNPTYLFENANYANLIDQPLQSAFNSSVLLNNQISFSQNYTVNVFLKDLFPFMETGNRLFPPGVEFTFRFRFNALSAAKKCILNGAPFTPIVSAFSFLSIDNSVSSWPVSTNNTSMYMYVKEFFPKENIRKELLLNTYFIYNTWTYEMYQQVLNTPSPALNINLDMKATPSRIFIYFTPPNNEPFRISPPNATQDYGDLFGDGNGYLVGYNISQLKISLNGVDSFSIEDTENISPNLTLFDQNMSGFDFLINNDDYLNTPDGKSRIILQKLNTAIDNFIPHAFSLSPELLNTPDVRPINNQYCNLTLQMNFNHTFKYTNSSSTTTYFSTLPIGTTINMLLQYGTQYIIDDQRNLNYIREPRYLIQDTSQPKTNPDLATPYMFNGN